MCICVYITNDNSNSSVFWVLNSCHFLEAMLLLSDFLHFHHVCIVFHRSLSLSLSLRHTLNRVNPFRVIHNLQPFQVCLVARYFSFNIHSGFIIYLRRSNYLRAGHFYFYPPWVKYIMTNISLSLTIQTHSLLPNSFPPLLSLFTKMSKNLVPNI